MLRLLSRVFTLALCGAGTLLLAGSASALTATYNLLAGSEMSMVNQACPALTPCTVALTGSVTLTDDLGGNVTLDSMSLAHAPYEVGLLPFLSVVLERTSIGLGAGPVAGTGSLFTSALLGASVIAQTGTTTCTDGIITCASQGQTAGSVAMPPLLPVNLGTWSFTPDGVNLTASFTYLSVVTPSVTETMTLVAQIPEPGTMALVAMGVVALAIRRRAGY